MELSYETKTLRALCLDPTTAEGKLGDPLAAILRATLADLDAAVTLVELPSSGSLRYAGMELRVDLGRDHELLCESGAGQGDPPDWSRVYRLKLIRVQEQDDRNG